jgi:serine protease
MGKREARAVALGFVLCAVLLLVVAIQAQARENLSSSDLISYGPGEAVAGEILVQFNPGASRAAIDAINRAHGTSVAYRSPFAGFFRLRLPPGRGVAEMVAAYQRQPQVTYAEPDFVRRALTAPNDPYYSYQWNFDDSLSPNPYGGANGGGINLEPAWDVSTGAGVIVAVIDTGIAYENYSERAGQRRRTYYQAPDLAQTAFAPGYDFVNNDLHPNDDNSHGTHVAGTIAESTSNGVGVAGVAFDATLMPVKVLDANGSGTDAEVADGIYYAVNNGADVLNLSLGGAGSSTTLGNAVAYAYEHGATIVCAAGNEGDRLNRPSYPAAYDAYCIAVAATRYDETRAYYSNYGSYIDIAAPGGDVTVDQNGDGYGDGVLQNTFNPNTRNTGDFGYWFFQGTSMATPHVSGVAALLIADGVTGPDQVREALQSTAEDKGAPGWDSYYGWGIVDAYAALGYAFAPVHDVAVTGVSAPSSAVQGEAVSVDATAANLSGFAETFTVTLEDATDSVSIGSQTVSLAAYASETLSFTWTTTAASTGNHVLRAQASAVSGESNLTNNVATTTVSIIPPGQMMHIAAIDMALKTAGANTSGLATVTIVDSGNAGVSGASVSGHWSGATSDSDTGLTDSTGRVTLRSDNVKRASQSTTFTFTVDNVSLAGWSYDTGSDLETSGSISVP